MARTALEIENAKSGMHADSLGNRCYCNPANTRPPAFGRHWHSPACHHDHVLQAHLMPLLFMRTPV